MEIINRDAQRYAEDHTTAESALLARISRDTHAKVLQPNMLSGHLQGRLLSMISHMVRPNVILEIGTFTGFSALCLARGLKPGGKLHTIEIREEDARTAKGYFERSIFAERIILHTGNALSIIPELQEKWDLVFIDADKTGYLAYYKLILPHVNSGGMVIADNVLFHGEVLEQPVKGKNAKAISEFNDFVKSDDRVEQVLLPIRDGLMLIRKK